MQGGLSPVLPSGFDPPPYLAPAVQELLGFEDDRVNLTHQAPGYVLAFEVSR